MNKQRSSRTRTSPVNASIRCSRASLQKNANPRHPGDKRMAEHVIGEWAECGDETHRFDALAMIDDFKITRRRASTTAVGKALIG